MAWTKNTFFFSNRQQLQELICSFRNRPPAIRVEHLKDKRNLFALFKILFICWFRNGRKVCNLFFFVLFLFYFIIVVLFILFSFFYYCYSVLLKSFTFGEYFFLHFFKNNFVLSVLDLRCLKKGLEKRFSIEERICKREWEIHSFSFECFFC